MTWFGGVYDDVTHQFPSMGIDADNPDVIWPEYAIDRDLRNRFKSEKNGALVGVATMQRFRWHIGDEVALHQPSTPLTLTFKIIVTINQAPTLPSSFSVATNLEDATHNPGFTSILWFVAPAWMIPHGRHDRRDVSRLLDRDPRGDREGVYGADGGEIRADCIHSGVDWSERGSGDCTRGAQRYF